MEQLDTRTAMGREMFTMIGMIAELERNMIKERTQASFNSAKAHGRKHKPMNTEKLNRHFNNTTAWVTRFQKLLKNSVKKATLQTLYKYLNKLLNHLIKGKFLDCCFRLVLPIFFRIYFLRLKKFAMVLK